MKSIEQKASRTDLSAHASNEAATEAQSLLEIVNLARELVSPKGMVNRGVDRGLVVVEKADKSDPHYRLCTALEKYDRALLRAAAPPNLVAAARYAEGALAILANHFDLLDLTETVERAISDLRAALSSEAPTPQSGEAVPALSAPDAPSKATQP